MHKKIQNPVQNLRRSVLQNYLKAFRQKQKLFLQNTLSYIRKRVLNAPLLGATIKCCVRFKQNRKIQKLSDEKHIGLISENLAKKKEKVEKEK